MADGSPEQKYRSAQHQPTCPLRGQSEHPKIVRGSYCQTCLSFTPSGTEPTEAQLRAALEAYSDHSAYVSTVALFAAVEAAFKVSSIGKVIRET